MIVQEVLKTQSNLINIVKTIVGHFKRSFNANYQLILYQENSGTTPKKLLKDIATRWNSIFHMLNRFVELETTIKATLAIIDTDLHILTPEEWKVCKELCLVLKPFNEVTTLISGENYMCASMIIVLYKGLADVCEKFKNKSFDSSVKRTIQVLQDGITSRFSDLEMSNTLRMATFLDPKFKHHALSKSLGE